MSTQLPDLGVVFWPVGSGDSSTVVVSDEVVMQVDLNDRAKADDEDNPEVPVVDLLVESLPEGDDGRPFLAAFVLTHADQDHCSGFRDLMEQATIGELWATPRMWRELADDPDAVLCEDAQAFHEEVRRRVDAVKEAVAAEEEIKFGDRVLVVGYDTAEGDYDYHDLPAEYLLKPGMAVTTINGEDHAGRFEAFIHAPFKDDGAAARNDTSLSLQVVLTEAGGEVGKVLLFGDLAYDTIIKIFDYSEDHDRGERLEWDLLLAPHHCSKSVMYIKQDGAEVLKTDVLDAFQRYARGDAVVVASSSVIPTSDTPGANPPHKKAANRYKELAGRFICTMEWPSKDDPSPVVFGVDAVGAHVVDDDTVEMSAAPVTKSRRNRLSEVAAAATRAGRLAASTPGDSAEDLDLTGPERVRAAVAADRGAQQAPTTAVGFGAPTCPRRD